MTALYIVLIVIAVIMFLLLIPIDCIAELSYNNKENSGSVIIKFTFLKFKLYPPDKAVKEEAEEEKEEEQQKNFKPPPFKTVKTLYSELKEDIKRFIHQFLCHTIRIKEMNISAKFGTGDPMYTGIAVGAANAAIYNAVLYTDRHFKLDKWHISIDGDFDRACIAAGIYLKLRTRSLHVLKLGIMLAVLLLRIQKINRRIKKDV